MRTSRYRKRLQKSRRRRRTSKKTTKNRRIRKKATRKRRGGASPKISATPSQSYGFEHGSCPRTNAANYQTSQNARQQDIINTHGGAKRKRGGSAEGLAPLQPKTIDVPQFPQQGPIISPQGANNTSVATNTSAVSGTVNATNDCYATNSCVTKGGSRRTRHAGRKGIVKWGCMSGGKNSRRRGIKRILWGSMG